MDSDSFLSILLNTQFIFLPAISIVLLLIATLLLYLSALLSGAETAFSALSFPDKNEIEEKKSNRDDYVRQLLSRSNEFQSGLSFWTNLLNVGIVILTLYAFNPFVNQENHYFVLLIEVIALVLFIYIIGEIIPKLYAQNNPLEYLRKISPLLLIVEKISRPFSSLIAKMNLFVSSSKKKNNDVPVDELSKAFELTSDELTDEKNILKGIINLYNKTAVEIMTPRMDVALLEISANFKDVLSYIVEVEYSRIPVYSETPDEIKGILYIKDLLPYLNQPDNFHWQKLIRPAFFIPETKKIDDLLDEFRNNKKHIAIVVDEYGGTSGIVTLEDILEEIVGEINDEYDDEKELKYTHLKDGSYIFEGKILLSDFFRITGIDSKVFGKLTDEIDTLAGLILEIKGDFPELKEIVYYDNYSFRILDMDNKRILKIKFQTNNE